MPHNQIQPGSFSWVETEPQNRVDWFVGVRGAHVCLDWSPGNMAIKNKMFSYPMPSY